METEGNRLLPGGLSLGLLICVVLLPANQIATIPHSKTIQKQNERSPVMQKLFSFNFVCFCFVTFVKVWMNVCSPLCRRAVHRWRDQEHVQQSAQAHCIPGRVPRLPGLRGPEWETPRPDCRCPPQGGSGGTRLRRWVMEISLPHTFTSTVQCLPFIFRYSAALSVQKGTHSCFAAYCSQTRTLTPWSDVGMEQIEKWFIFVEWGEGIKKYWLSVCLLLFISNGNPVSKVLCSNISIKRNVTIFRQLWTK